MPQTRVAFLATRCSSARWALVDTPRELTPDDPDYPARLRTLSIPPPAITLVGTLAPAKVIAIVGTRKPIPAAADFARALAAAVARSGAVVASGGAFGIDSAAHEGALDAGGRTWVVAATGHGVQYPKGNAGLFDRIAASSGALVWPFPAGTPGHRSRFFRRNAVLVALADVLVIVQARIPSGALNAATYARRLGRPRWVVCPLPWNAEDPDFAGCRVERRLGARALTSIDTFLTAVELPRPPAACRPSRAMSATENRVLAAVSREPRHVDAVSAQCGLPYPEVMTALLTLRLEDVLVEGPEGFFRSRRPP